MRLFHTACAKTPLIYNLFPRFYRSVDEWSPGAARAHEMGFNWVFVNPFHATGLSGSLYAIKDYYLLNPLFLKPGQDPSDWRPLKKFVAACNKKGCGVMMDLVINHTAFDSPLTQTHPQWYLRDNEGRLICPSAINPGSDHITVWGDLAEINNRDSGDRKGLWEYWDGVIKFFQDMGITGFRCDAAYKVPADLWRFLISAAKGRNAQAVFVAETLGCRLEQVDDLYGTGFDYLFNSSKYWNFDQPWCLEQHERNKRVAPSISFPESHDTPRLASEDPGTETMQRSRYLFSAIFSEGLLMPMGYEYGAKKAIDVVRGTPADLEAPQWDMTRWIRDINAIKTSSSVLCHEGSWKSLTPYDRDVLFLEKWVGGESALVCINKDRRNGRNVSRSEGPQEIDGYKKMLTPIIDPQREQRAMQSFSLGPGEIAIFMR